ncbi:MAG: putative F420-dependent oxidoreductase [Acidimicrobiales bacterium]|jgi:probable F420-dependent oxidoreductase
MKVGINLINFGPSASPHNMAGWVDLAERLGFHSLLTSDHVTITPDVSERYPAPFYEPLSTLGWLAGVTSTLAIGTTVSIVPYRNPLELARSLANVDQLSGGRLIFGVGIGWAEREFAALNVAFRRRGAITDEYLDVITRHWTQDTLTFDGEFVQCQGIDTAPRPMQAAVPIWVGGSSAAALRRTVRFGTAWHPIRVRATWLADVGIPRLAAAAEAAGKPTPEVCPRILFHPTAQSVDDPDRFMGHGSMAQIAEDLGLLDQLGCPHVILDSYSPFDDSPFDAATTELVEVWQGYEMLATDVLDLGNQKLR